MDNNNTDDILKTIDCDIHMNRTKSIINLGKWAYSLRTGTEGSLYTLQTYISNKQLQECVPKNTSIDVSNIQVCNHLSVSGANFVCPGHSNPRLPGEARPSWSTKYVDKIRSIASTMIRNIKIRREPNSEGLQPSKFLGCRLLGQRMNNTEAPLSFTRRILPEPDNHTKESIESTKISVPYSYYVSSKSWKPPHTHGLDNSPRIIPDYYTSTCMNPDNNILRVDYKFMILDDIRNLRKLSYYQLKYIKNMNSEDKQEIIEEFNRVIESFLLTLE